MAAFELSVEDLLKISLSAHACLLLRALLGKLVDWLAPLLSRCSSRVRSLHRVHKRQPDLIPRILSEQLSLLAVVVLALLALSHTSVSLVPFGYQAQPTPGFLIRLVLCASAARHLVMASRLLLGRENTLVKSCTMIQVRGKTCAGESGTPFWDLFNAVICGVSSLLCLAYHQNLLLGMTLPFQELSSCSVELCRLYELTKAAKTAPPCGCEANSVATSPTYRRMALVTCALCVVCRVVLPTLFLSLAVEKESPLVMDAFPLVWFLLSCTFMWFFHGLLIFRAVCRFNSRGGGGDCHVSSCSGDTGKTGWCVLSPLHGAAQVCWDGNGYAATASVGEDPGGRGTAGGGDCGYKGRDHSSSIHGHPDILTNDIRRDIVLAKQDFAHTRLGRLRELNYGLLHPCDNRNVSDFSCSKSLPDGGSDGPAGEGQSGEGVGAGRGDAVDKMNVVRKKDVAKTWLMYTLLADSIPTSTTQSASPSSSLSSPSHCTASSCDAASTPTTTATQIDPLVLPALFDANNKRVRVKYEEDGPMGGNLCSDEVALPLDNYQCSFRNTYGSSLTNDTASEREPESLNSAEIVEGAVVRKSVNPCHREPATATPLSHTAVGDRTKGEEHESSASAKAIVYSDLIFEMGGKAKVPAPRKPAYHKRRDNLSHDCIQLLDSSSESSVEGFADLGDQLIAG